MENAKQKKYKKKKFSSSSLEKFREVHLLIVFVLWVWSWGNSLKELGLELGNNLKELGPIEAETRRG